MNAKFLVEEEVEKLVNFTGSLYVTKGRNHSVEEWTVVGGISRGGATMYYANKEGEVYYYGEDPGTSSDGMVITGNWAEVDELSEEPVEVGSEEFAELGLTRAQYDHYAKLMLANGDKVPEITVKVPEWVDQGLEWEDEGDEDGTTRTSS
jgi:hypothetical protein